VGWVKVFRRPTTNVVESKRGENVNANNVEFNPNPLIHCCGRTGGGVADDLVPRQFRSFGLIEASMSKGRNTDRFEIRPPLLDCSSGKQGSSSIDLEFEATASSKD
jgi:hypothetical protein